MDKPSLRQLDIFAQMIAAGTIERCARDMAVPVDQIRHELTVLEERLGYRLFEDDGFATRLTPAGHKTAQAMTLLSQDKADDWADDRPVDDGTPDAPVPTAATPPPATFPPAMPPSVPARQTILLAAPAPIFSHFQDALAAFEEANEDIAIALDLTVQSAADVDAALRNGRADIAYFYALEEPGDFASRYGWSEPLNLYVGDAHPLAHAQSVTSDDLIITAMLALSRTNPTRHMVDDALLRGGVTLGPPILETDTIHDLLAALRDGGGCFPAFGAIARDLGRMTGIRRLPLEVPLPAIQIRQAIGPRAAQTPAVEALADFLFL